jgi:hypothetical protein
MRLSLRAPFFKACRRAEKAPRQFHYTPRAQKKPWAAQKFAFRSQKFFPAFTARPSCGVLPENFHLKAAVFPARRPPCRTENRNIIGET